MVAFGLLIFREEATFPSPLGAWTLGLFSAFPCQDGVVPILIPRHDGSVGLWILVWARYDCMLVDWTTTRPIFGPPPQISRSTPSPHHICFFFFSL